MIRRPPRPTLFPYPPLSRSGATRDSRVVTLGARDQLDVKAWLPRRPAGRSLRGKPHHEGTAPARRRCNRRMRHSVIPMIRNDTPVVTVPIANKVGEVALEISA